MNKKKTKFDLLIERIAQEINENSSLRLDVLIKNLSDTGSSQSEILLCLNFFESFGSISMNPLGYSNQIINLIKPIDLTNLIEPEFEVEDIPPELIVSLPQLDQFGLKAHLDIEKIYYRKLEDAFREVIKNAKTSVKIMSPFLDVGGLKRIEDIITLKSNSGVKISIIARNLLKPEKTERYKALKKYLLGIRNKMNTNNFKLREYHYSTSFGRVESSVHAKFIVADENFYYCGSGEVRKNSFTKNLETGLMGKGKIGRYLSEIFNFFSSVSEEIEWE